MKEFRYRKAPEELSQELRELSPHEEIPEGATAGQLQRLITQRLRALMQQFPPGTVVRINGHRHLIKTYVMDKVGIPENMVAESLDDGGRRYPQMSALVGAEEVALYDPTELAQAQFWRDRHLFRGAVEDAIRKLSTSAPHLLIDLQFLERMSFHFMDQYWPAKQERPTTDVTDTVVEDFVRRWMDSRKGK